MSDKLKKHWKEVKVDFLKNIGNFKVNVEFPEDEDYEYYHPIVIIDDGLTISGQCDIKSNYVYGLSIKIDRLNSHMYNLHLDGYQQLNFICNNWDKIKVRVNETLEKVKSLYDMQENLKNLQTNIMCDSINEIIDTEKRRVILKDIYNLTEFLENNNI